MRNSKLHVKVLIALVLFALSIILFSSILVRNLYSETTMEESRQLSFSYAKTAAGLIDGDKVETYAETLEKDEYALRAKRIEIPASITGLEFYKKLGYDYKDNVTVPDEEGLYRLEKYR